MREFIASKLESAASYLRKSDSDSKESPPPPSPVISIGGGLSSWIGQQKSATTNAEAIRKIQREYGEDE